MKHVSGLSASFVSAIVSLAAASAGRASVIFDSGAPDEANGNSMDVAIQANSFTLAAPATLDAVRFWDVQYSFSYQGSITWSIYANAANNVPGTAIAGGSTSAVTRAATGNVVLSYDEYVNDFSISPVTLAAGTYWIGLHNGPLTQTTNSYFFWETTAANNSPILGAEDDAPFDGTWVSNGSDHAFQLLSSVPEPATAGVFLLAGPALLLRRRRRDGRA